MNILIAPSTFGVHDDKPIRILEERGFNIIKNPYGRKITKEELKPILKNIYYVIAGLEEYDDEIISNSNLKLLSRCGSGIDNINLEAVKKHGVKIFNTPRGPTQSVAELTIGCMISLVRNLTEMDSNMHCRKWKKMNGFLIKEKQILIIGYGAIGKRVAEILSFIGAEILVYDPFVNKNEINPNYTKVDLNEGLKNANIISLHCSGNSEIIGEKQFEIMKKGIFILNSARGGIVNEKALEINLQNKKVRGAWLDTFINEPYNGNLKNFKQVILTPHIGSYTIEGRKKMEIDSVNNIINNL
tara:strand:- start:247 stop:1146 length:900 start_codon:yes stop_codon:yes gene_type:complete